MKKLMMGGLALLVSFSAFAKDVKFAELRAGEIKILSDDIQRLSPFVDTTKYPDGASVIDGAFVANDTPEYLAARKAGKVICGLYIGPKATQADFLWGAPLIASPSKNRQNGLYIVLAEFNRTPKENGEIPSVTLNCQKAHHAIKFSEVKAAFRGLVFFRDEADQNL